MKILITGATGFIGEALSVSLLKQGHQVVGTTRDLERAKALTQLPIEWVAWEGENEPLPDKAFKGCDAIIHLAGESVPEKKWSSERKRRILNSRIESTRRISEALDSKPHGVKTWINASAIGYYGNREDHALNEESEPGTGFLADVCQEWEKAANATSVRTACVRIGLVLGHGGGALEKLIPLYRSGLGARLGNGRHWMSWIHIDDLVRLFEWILHHENAHGAFNGTAPHPVTNLEFTERLTTIQNVRMAPPVPAIVLKALYGEMSHVLLDSQKVFPKKAPALGFDFLFPDLQYALQNLYPEAGEVFLRRLWFPKKRETLFDFFSNAENLEKISPSSLEFKIVSARNPKIEKGTIIDYRLKIRGFPVEWKTRISEYEPPVRFMDFQEKGPYGHWHHLHLFEELQNGTLMTDLVRFRLPLGAIGTLAARAFVIRDIEGIFEFRKQSLQKILLLLPA